MLLNIFSAQLLNFYILKSFENKISIHIGKVKRVFLPIYFEVDNVSIKNADGLILFKEGRCEINLRSFFSRKPFISLFFKDFIYENKGNKNRESNVKFLFDDSLPFYIIKDLTIENFIIKRLEDSVVVENINVQNNKSFQIVVKNFSVFDRKLKVNNLNLKLIGKLFKHKLVIHSATVQGIDIDGKFNGYFGQKGYEAKFQLKLGTNFLKLVNINLKGDAKITGNIRSGSIRAEVVTDRLYYSSEPVQIKGVFKGTLDNLKYEIEKFHYKNFDITAFGKTDLKSLKGNWRFNSPLVIYKDKQRKFIIKDASYNYNLSKKKGSIKFEIIGAENYQVHIEIQVASSDIFIKKIQIQSNSTKLKGVGSYENKSLKLILNGVVKDNKELIKLLNLSHNINISLEIELNNEGFFAKGTFKGLAPLKYHNLNISNYYGDFKLDKGFFDFKILGDAEEGKISVIGQLKKKFNKYKVTIYNLPFNKVLGYFGVKSNINLPVSGEVGIQIADSKVFVRGGLNKVNGFKSLKIDFSYENKRLNIDSLAFKNKEYKNPGYIDFYQRKINFNINDRKFKYTYKLFEIEGLRVRVEGNLLNPFVMASGNIIHPKLGNLKMKVSGNFRSMKVKLFDKKIRADFDITNLKILKGIIAINNYKLEKDTKISSFVYVKSEDMKNFSFISSKSLIYYKNNTIELIDLHGNYRDEFLILKGGSLSSDYFKNLKIKEGYFSPKNFTLKLVPWKINFKNFVVIKGEGEILIKGNYSDTDVFADVSGKGFVNIPELNLKVNVISFNLNINRKRIRASLIGKKLDTYIRFSLFSKDLYQISQYKIILTGENVFISKDGFSGILNINITKKVGKNVVTGDLFITKGIFNYKKIKTVSSTSEKVNFPFDFDMHILSVKPIKLMDDFVDGNAYVKLNVVYKKDQLNVTGVIKSVESYLKIAGEKFFVEEGYLKIDGDKPPYFYTKAIGTGSFNYLTIKIYGYLPDYTVEIEDLNPNSRENIFNKSRTQSKNVISSFFTGSLLKELTRYTEKLLGINRIGLEETSVSGTEMRDYFKVGRRFSDRLEIKYLVETEGKGEGVVLGEYLLFDWLKFNVTYSSKEGSGAGITFFTSF
ncbi:translocation/assembly module TamB domain-containing protein [Deferribacter abyssi]|uniref:translocation/assembly module TamB domain-containing protein n=1 Tax=Deferribacter abyssi TaxID=213806 RepID=UPI003C27979F